jgi:hypothetical protein
LHTSFFLRKWNNSLYSNPMLKQETCDFLYSLSAVTCPHGSMVEHFLPCMVKCSPLCTEPLLCQVHHLLCCCMCRICPLKSYCSLLSLLQGLWWHEIVSHGEHSLIYNLNYIKLNVTGFKKKNTNIHGLQSITYFWNPDVHINKCHMFPNTVRHINTFVSGSYVHLPRVTLLSQLCIWWKNAFRSPHQRSFHNETVITSHCTTVESQYIIFITSLAFMRAS